MVTFAISYLIPYGHLPRHPVNTAGSRDAGCAILAPALCLSFDKQWLLKYLPSLFIACDPCINLYAYSSKPASCCLLVILLSTVFCSAHVFLSVWFLVLFPVAVRLLPLSTSPHNVPYKDCYVSCVPPTPKWALRFATPDEPFLESTRRHPPTLLRWYSYLPRYIGSHPVWSLYVFFRDQFLLKSQSNTA